MSSDAKVQYVPPSSDIVRVLTVTTPSPSSSLNTTGGGRPLPPIGIAVIGAIGSGKSSFVNIASNSQHRAGSNLQSAATDVEPSKEFIVDGRRVFLIDTPGFDDNTVSDAEILKKVAAFLAVTYEKGYKLAGIVYVHRISDDKFTGVSTRNFRMFKHLCGDSTLKNVILVTNMWGRVEEQVGERHEKQLIKTHFKPALDKGAQIARHFNTTQSAHEIIRRIIKNDSAPFRIQRELVDEHRQIENTLVGEAVNEELNKALARHKDEMMELREEMRKKLAEKEGQSAKEMREADRLRKQMGEMMVETAAVGARYEEERKGMKQAMQKKMQEQALQEKQKAHEEYTKQINELRAKLEGNVNTSARQREELRRISEPERQRHEQAAKEMREEADKLRKQMDEMRVERAAMAARYEEERKGTEQAMRKKMQEQTLQERQKAHEEYTKQINELKAKLEENVNTSARQREELEHQRPEQAAKEMREEADKLRKQVDKMRAEMADMAAKYEEERKGMEQAILKKMQDQALRERQRMQEQALQERQEAHENYTKQINELNAKLEGNVNTSARQREEHLRRIRELESLLPNSSSKKSGSCVII